MARNYHRGGGGGGGRNDPPGWGGGGNQPARQFAFGNAANANAGAGWGQQRVQQHAQQQRQQQPQQQQQMQNRFQPLRGPGNQAPARGACYTCGVVGHMARDCPQTRSGGRDVGVAGGGSGGFTSGGGRAPQQQHVDVRRAVVDDMQPLVTPPWPLTCYAPDVAPSQAGATLMAGDVSFEEARAMAYAALVMGGPPSGQAATRQLAELAHARLADRQRLAQLPGGDLERALQAAAAGQPLQCAMPSLPYDFPHGAPVVNAQAFMQAPPQAPRSSGPFAQFSQMAQQEQQGPSPIAASVLRQFTTAVLPGSGLTGHAQQQQQQQQQQRAQPGVAPPAAEVADGRTDADWWNAPEFQHGRIPEVAPPPNVV